MNFLEEIVNSKKNEISLRKTYCSFDYLINEVAALRIKSNFKSSLSKETNTLNLIAEIKHASPSKGIIRNPFDHIKIAKIYDTCKVSAISVLTEEKYFKGKLQYLKDISKLTSTPLLLKDFIIDEYQIYEAVKYNASAILLIAAILNEKQINTFIQTADKFGLDCLVEVHNKKELDKVLNTNASIIGINNRNLETFEVDLNTSLNLINLIPNDKILVSESGIKSKEDIKILKFAGFNAVLIGETFMREENIAAKIADLFQ